MNEDLEKALKVRGFSQEQISLIDEAIQESRRASCMFPCFRMSKSVMMRFGIPPDPDDLGRLEG